MKLKMAIVLTGVLLSVSSEGYARRTPDHSLTTLRMALAHRRPQKAATKENPQPSLAAAQHPLVMLIPQEFFYEKGKNLEDTSKVLINEAVYWVSADPSAWNVRQQAVELFEEFVGHTPKFIDTNAYINDVFDVLSLEQIIAKNQGIFPKNFASRAEQDQVGEQLFVFMLRRYLLGYATPRRVTDYLWDMYNKAPNARPIEQTVTQAEEFLSKHNRLPALDYFAASPQVADTVRSSMQMRPEEVELGADLLMVTEVSRWAWRKDVPAQLRTRIKRLDGEVKKAREQLRAQTPFERSVFVDK